MKNAPITPEQKVKIKDLTLKGYDPKPIARHLGLDPRQVSGFVNTQINFNHLPSRRARPRQRGRLPYLRKARPGPPPAPLPHAYAPRALPPVVSPPWMMPSARGFLELELRVLCRVIASLQEENEQLKKLLAGSRDK